MKDSGVRWIGYIPEHWGLNKIKYNSVFEPKQPNKLNDDLIVGYAPMECIKQGYMISNTIEYEKVKGGYTYFADDDIVMAKVTPCFENENIALAKDLANGIGFGSSELYVFRAEKIKKEYFYYYIRNYYLRKEWEGTMYGTGGLKRVSSYYVKNAYIPIPTVEEQENISKYLANKENQINSTIHSIENVINNLESYKKSLIYECVTGKREVK